MLETQQHVSSYQGTFEDSFPFTKGSHEKDCHITTGKRMPFEASTVPETRLWTLLTLQESSGSLEMLCEGYQNHHQKNDQFFFKFGGVY